TGSNQADPDTADNSAVASLLAQAPTADLALAKGVAPTAASVGDLVTFTVTLSNIGPDDATGVTVSDVLPAGLSFVSATPSQGTFDPSTGLWVVGAVMTTTSPTLAILARVVSPPPLTNTATIAHSDQVDPVPGNDTASVELAAASAD